MRLRPATILVTFFNVLIFMFCQTLIFWYVVSKSVENIVIDKSHFIGKIIGSSTVFIKLLNNYTKSEEYQLIYNKSVSDSIKRENFNYELTFQWMFFPFLSIVVVLVLGLIYTIFVHFCTGDQELRFDKVDVIILLLVFFAFLTEIAIIFILIMRYVYISDAEVIIFLIEIGII